MREFIAIAMIALAGLLLVPTEKQEDIPPVMAPAGAVAMEIPLGIYRQYWQEISNCSQLTGRFENIHWWIVPGTQFQCNLSNKEEQCVGLWIHQGHNIYIASLWITIPQVVEHEMLHELISDQQKPITDPHPPVFDACHVM